MNIQIRYRTLFYVVTIFIVLWFVYQQFEIFTPFIVALIFAYIFNPLINFFYYRFKIPRTISIMLVYALLITSVVLLVLLMSNLFFGESVSIRESFAAFIKSLRTDVRSLPLWMQPHVISYIDYFTKDPLNGNVHIEPFPFVARAFSSFINIFAFLFAAFFFLKDYKKMIDKLIALAPEKYHEDVNTLVRQINKVMSGYLRGQLVIIVSMAIMLFACFSVLGVRNALTISIVSSLFEIVPIIGPIAAAIFGAFIVIISGGFSTFPTTPVFTMLITLAIYYLTRQIQDYFIMPYVFGRATKLHPLIIFFSVIAGEHMYGILGVILAIPVAATIKLTYQFIFERVRNSNPK